MSRPTTSTPIPPKPTKVHPAINHHIAVLKRVPPQLIQRAAERLLPPAVPVAAGLAVELFQALFHEGGGDGLVEDFGLCGGAGEVAEGVGRVEGFARGVVGLGLGLGRWGLGAVASGAGGGVGHARAWERWCC